jgi:hypothetical protein
MGNKAAWSCDVCRKSGLESKRRCGWQGNDEAPNAPIVWNRGRSALSTCPTSYISAESVALIEEFHAWKLLGGGTFYALPARLVEAIFILETELRAEPTDG